MGSDWINYALFIAQEMAETAKVSSDKSEEPEAVKSEENILQKFGIWDIYSAISANSEAAATEAVVPESLETVVDDIRHNTYQKAGDLAFDIQQIRNNKPAFGLGEMVAAGMDANAADKKIAEAVIMANESLQLFSDSNEKNEESQRIQSEADKNLTNSAAKTRAADERGSEAESEVKESEQKDSEADTKTQEASTRTAEASSKRQESERLNSEAQSEIASADAEILAADTAIADAEEIISNANSATPQTEEEAAAIFKQKTEAEQAQADALKRKENAAARKAEAEKKRAEADKLNQEAQTLETEANELQNGAEQLNKEAEVQREHADELNSQADDFREEASSLQNKGETEQARSQALVQEGEKLNNEAQQTKNSAEQTEQEADAVTKNAQVSANDAIDKEINSNINGKIEATEQGDTGDCWLLSDINSMNQTEWGRKAISDAVKSDGNGGAKVTFNGAAEGEQNCYDISAQELAEAKKSGKYSTGDDDMLALELATEKYLTKYKDKYNRNAPDGVLNSMNGFSMENLLVKNVNTHLYYGAYDRFDQPLDALENNPRKYSVNCAFKSDQETYDMYKNHAYTLTGITTDAATGKKYAEAINPWDSSQKIRIPYDKFKQNLVMVMLTEPPGENNKNLNSFQEKFNELNNDFARLDQMVNTIQI